MPLLMTSIGCRTNQTVVELHPISQLDIILVDKGDTFTAPASGMYISDTYLQRVLKARVK